MISRRLQPLALVSALSIVLSMLAVAGAGADDHATPAPAECMGMEATIVGTSGDDDIDGTEGDDIISLGAGKDKADGKGGNDIICGGDGDDKLKGGDGDDTLKGEGGDDDLDGKDGDDVLDGGDGDDKAKGKDGDDTLLGGPGEDDLKGDKGDDDLDGGEGDDKLDGKDGNDLMSGGDGDDDLKGGKGDDDLDGGDGEDKLDGKQGDDNCINGEEVKNCEREDPRDPGDTEITGTGSVLFSTGGVVAGADADASFDGGPAAGGATDDGGMYSLTAEGTAPGLFRVDVSTTVDGVPITGSRYGFVAAGETEVALDPIELPNPAETELFALGGGDFGDFDEIRIIGLPAEVVSVFAEVFDYDTEPNAFPGLLGDDPTDPFNSTVFGWMTALDAAGSEVTTFPSPVTVRMRIPSHQHGDLFDLTPGNGVIDIPMYSFDEATGDWVVESTGIVTNSSGTPFAEADAPAIRAGGFFSVWAQFETDHFSWWNVDYKKSDFPGSSEPDFFDFGDAGGTYPTTLGDDGVRHDDPNRLWMGRWADQEGDAKVPDADDFDDGLLALEPVSVRVNNWDLPGDIYLNILIDRNDDGDWLDAGEWVVQNEVTGTPVFRGQQYDTAVSWDPVTEGAMRVTVTDVAIAAYDGTGSFALGETEDFLEPPTGDLSVFVDGDGAVTSDVGGIDCPDVECMATVAGGAPVTLTATPAPGREFLGWTGDCFDRGTNPTCTIIVPPSGFEFAGAVFSTEVVRAFSLAPGSPTLAANGWSPGDVLILAEDAGTVTRLFSTADLGLDPADDIDALSFATFDPPPPIGPFNDIGIEYSTTDASVGALGSNIETEAGCGAGELGGDVWAFAGFGEGVGDFTASSHDPFTPFQWVDEDGVNCATNSPFVAGGLVPGDEVDGWSRIDLGDPGIAYYSLAPGSPALGLLGATQADILETVGGAAIIGIPAADLGLVPGDDVDALSGTVGIGGGGEVLHVSLEAGSPSLAANGWGATYILTTDDFGGGFGPLFATFTESDLDLDPGDDLDAAQVYDFFFYEA